MGEQGGGRVAELPAAEARASPPISRVYLLSVPGFASEFQGLPYSSRSCVIVPGFALQFQGLPLSVGGLGFELGGFIACLLCRRPALGKRNNVLVVLSFW